METSVFKSKMSFLPLFFGLIGAIFFFSISYYLISARSVKPQSSDQSELIGFWILTGLFLFFALLSLFTILSVKTITLTDQNLSINRPLLFFKSTISLDHIKSVHEEDYEINSVANSRKVTVYKGKKTILETQKGKKIIFTSFDISEYDDFVYYLKRRNSSFPHKKSN